MLELKEKWSNITKVRAVVRSQSWVVSIESKAKFSTTEISSNVSVKLAALSFCVFGR